jgi:glycosyltransferase involved in cell wall biosynthesis
MILFIHHRYRLAGGEERAVDDLLWLVREHLREDAELLERRSESVRPAVAAAGLARGGLQAREVFDAVRRSRARIVHAHNLHPTLGWRSLAAARAAGARVVLHLHQYRLVCAVGVCFRDGEPCTLCHARNTLPGIVHNCRGSRPEAVAYGAALALWQRRLIAQADAIVTPSHFAAAALTELGAPVGAPFVLAHVARTFAPRATGVTGGPALLAARLVPEKGIETAIEACRIATIPLLIAGEGPERARLQERADDVRWLGRLDPGELAAARGGASVALAPSRFAETFGLAAAEAMAAGLPVAASRIGALPELVEEDGLAAPGDAHALAEAIARLAADPEAGSRSLARARSLLSPEAIAPRLAAIYDHAMTEARRRGRAGRRPA